MDYVNIHPTDFPGGATRVQWGVAGQIPTGHFGVDRRFGRGLHESGPWVVVALAVQ
jgi:hypothetical protein